MHKSPALLVFIICFLGAEVRSQDVSVRMDAPDSVYAGEDFQISVRIAKGANTGIAKLQLEIPPGFIADSLSSDSARFSSADSKAKYIWDRMPAMDTLLALFRISTDPGFSGAKGVNGHFAFLVNEEKGEVSIPTHVIVVQRKEPTPAVALKEPADTGHSEVVAIQAKDNVQPETSSFIPEVTEKPVPVPATGREAKPSVIDFRVQIAAATTKMDPAALVEKYHIRDNIQSELHNDMWKYTVGNFPSYKDAKVFLSTIREGNGVSGAFITAYQNGERISVQSAINQTK